MALFFRQLREALDRNSAAFDRHAAAFDRQEEAFRDFQAAFRQDRLRAERVFGEQMAVLADMRAGVNEMRAEIRANTQAILRVLDRWGEGPTPAS